MKLAKKWKKLERNKTVPLAVTPLVEAVMAYGHACQEYGKMNQQAITAKMRGAPNQNQLWAASFVARDTVEERLRGIAEGWALVTSQPLGFVEPEPEVDE